MTDHTFLVEMRGQTSTREVDADLFNEKDGWLVFHRRSPLGGTVEYWRVRLDAVISMETRRKT